jgi:nicotinamidase-related amidase
MMREWEAIFTDIEREVLQRAGYAQEQEFGKQPALLLIDYKTTFIGTTRKPILEAVAEFKNSCGEAGWDAAIRVQKLLDACRTGGVPVVYVTGDPHYRHFTTGSVKGDNIDPRQEEIFPAVAPKDGELVVRKTKASGFVETPLASCLRDMGIDTLLVTGCTTSGCVRASVIDAFNAGFKCFIVEECVFDRFPLSHLVNLWDMHAKYGDVITLDRALEYVADFGKSRK